MSSFRQIRLQLPPEQCTTIGEETPPGEVGLMPAAIDRIWGHVERLYAVGVNPAIALTLRRHGALVLDRAIGHARGNGPDDRADTPKVLCRPDTPFCIFSASKAITAMLIHMLDDRGLLHVDDRVAEYIPEFARNGKEWVTIRHVLCHRAGLPSLRASVGLDILLDPLAVVELLCDARPESAPGRRLAYHAVTGGFILGEVVRRVTGRDIATLLREEVLQPLGLHGMTYGWPADRQHEVAVNAFTGPPIRFPVRQIAARALGIDFDQAANVSNSPQWLSAVVPAGNIVSNGAELTRFFELLRREGELDGVRIFSPRTIRRAVVETAHLELDLTMLLPIRYGVGLMLGANHISVFGPGTPRAFGHLGFTNIFAWTDPARAISVSLLTSGKPLLSRHMLPLGRLLHEISVSCPNLGA